MLTLSGCFENTNPNKVITTTPSAEINLCLLPAESITKNTMIAASKAMYTTLKLTRITCS